MSDIRYALRTLKRSPSFSITAILTLAIGLAVNTIAFTLLNSLALRLMPVRDPQRVVKVFPIDAQGHRENLFSYPDFDDYKADAPLFDGLAAYIPTTLTVRIGEAEPEDLIGYVVSPEYFPVLGIQPMLGRAFDSADERAANPVAVISHRLWERRFASNASVLGSRLVINDRSFTVVGVNSARFAGTEPLAPDVWVPAALQDAAIPGSDLLDDRSKPWLLVVGRLRPGVTREAAASSLTVAARRLALAFPSRTRPAGVAVVRGTFFTIDPELWPIIVLVLSIVAMVLAIACANVANLVLARATIRQREVAIRLAIGGSRWRVVRQLVTETVILSLGAGAVGLLLTTWVLAALYPVGLSLLPFEWGRVVLDLSPDLRVFGYTFGIAVVAGIALGVVPALQSSSPRISAALHDDAVVTGTGMKQSRLRQTLVVAQVAMCLALLTGAGLLARSLQRAHALDLGFDVDGVVFTEYDLRRHGYTSRAAADYNRALADAPGAGAKAVALTSHVPLHGGVVRTTVHAEGRGETAACTLTNVSPSYFRVLGIPVTSGRMFSDAESDAGSPVGVISAGLAARFWPGIDPLGRRLNVDGIPVPVTILGTVRDTSNASLWREKEMALYLPAGLADPRNLHVLARSEMAAAATASALRARAQVLDSRVTFRATSLDRLLTLWILPSRVATVAASLLGFLALTLASVGLYGVLGYTIAHRTREIGIRIALGATRGDVLRLILGDGARLIGAGVAAGLIGAFLVGRLLRRFLFDLGAFDPVAFAVVPLFLCAVALAACYGPARRASRIAPLVALRHQ